MRVSVSDASIKCIMYMFEAVAIVLVSRAAVDICSIFNKYAVAELDVVCGFGHCGELNAKLGVVLCSMHSEDIAVGCCHTRGRQSGYSEGACRIERHFEGTIAMPMQRTRRMLCVAVMLISEQG